MTIDWGEVLRTLGTTGLIVAALAWLAKAIIGQILARDLARSGIELKAQSDRQLEDLKAELKLHADREIEAVKAQAARELETIRHDFSKTLATYQARLESESARHERVTQEIVRWANPIRDSVSSLSARLDNILSDSGYFALSKEMEGRLPGDWSITHQYFMSSTLFLFAQYFCWVRLLHEKISFELLGSNKTVTIFFEKVWEVSRQLSRFPAARVATGQDMQVFALQQRGIGEALIIREDGVARCMRYAEYLQRQGEPTLADQLAPLKTFLQGITPDVEYRWQRLVLMRAALIEFGKHCEILLDPEKGGIAEQTIS